MTPLVISHSKRKKYETCPKQFFHTAVVQDVVEQSNDAAVWGNVVHEALEHRLRDGTPLPPSLLIYEGYCQSILRYPGTLHAELQLAINRKQRPCEWDAPDAFWRGIIDVCILNGSEARLIDHKTGKVKPDSQLMENALLVFHTYPEVQTVKTCFAWLAYNDTTKDVYHRHEIPQMWEKCTPFLSQYMKSFRNDVWPAKESGLCYGWCPVTSCTHWRKKRVKR